MANRDCLDLYHHFHNGALRCYEWMFNNAPDKINHFYLQGLRLGHCFSLSDSAYNSLQTDLEAVGFFDLLKEYPGK